MGGINKCDGAVLGTGGGDGYFTLEAEVRWGHGYKKAMPKDIFDSYLLTCNSHHFVFPTWGQMLYRSGYRQGRHPLLQIWTRLTITRQHMTAKQKLLSFILALSNAFDLTSGSTL